MSNLSKTKGRAFEYVVRDKCSDTFKSQFERVPLSGALTYLKGDVYAPWLPDFPWTIEAKHHKEVDWNNILTAKSNLLLEFWDQTTREAKVMNKLPLLVYKWDRSKIHCCWDDDRIKIDNYVFIQSANRKFYMGLFDDWLEVASKIYTKPN
jgi:hypothetical protein